MKITIKQNMNDLMQIIERVAEHLTSLISVNNLTFKLWGTA